MLARADATQHRCIEGFLRRAQGLPFLTVDRSSSLGCCNEQNHMAILKK